MGIGKKTYLHPVWTDPGVAHLTINGGRAKEIETALGRNLTDAEKNSIELELGKINLWSTDPIIEVQSIKCTLTGISKLSGKRAEDAYRDCDIHSQQFIRNSLYSHFNEFESKPPGDLISKAATHARDNLPKSATGRRKNGYQIMLADYVVSNWQTLGGEKCKAHVQESNLATATPIVQFGVALFTVVENYLFDASRVATLVREALVRAEVFEKKEEERKQSKAARDLVKQGI